jgi:hypothetical protein
MSNKVDRLMLELADALQKEGSKGARVVGLIALPVFARDGGATIDVGVRILKRSDAVPEKGTDLETWLLTVARTALNSRLDS